MSHKKPCQKITREQHSTQPKVTSKISCDGDHFADLQIVHQLDQNNSVDVDAYNKLTNSWVSLDNPIENINPSKKKNSNSKVNNQWCNANVRKDDLCDRDLVNLGYVVPENKGLFTLPCKKQSDPVLDGEDSSLVFVADRDCGLKDEEILLVNSDGSQLQSVNLNKITDIYSPQSADCSFNTTESFCELLSDETSEFTNCDKNKTEFSSANSDKSFFMSVPNNVRPRYPLYENNSPLHYLQKNQLPHHPEYSLLHDATDAPLNSHIPRRKSSQPGMSSYCGTEHEEPVTMLPVPKPPPELGLPDLTKKHLFPVCPADITTGIPSSEADASALVKNKVMGIWNNVKYGWTVNLGTNFSKNHPIVLLGNVYRIFFSTPGLSPLSEVSQSSSSMAAFRDAFHSLTWFSYRTKLPPLVQGMGAVSPEQQGSAGVADLLTSDCGWGCTLRCTQMMLCQALHRHFLGQDWVHQPGSGGVGEVVHGCLVRWFGDGSGRGGTCPLSLHRLVAAGSDRLGRLPGDWYTPSNAAIAARDALEAGSQYMPDLKRVTLYTSVNNIIFIQDILDLCWTPCICKMGKMAEYAKHQERPPKDFSPRHLQPSSGHRYGDTISDGGGPGRPVGGLMEAADALASFVQIDSLSSDLANACISPYNRPMSRESARLVMLNTPDQYVPGHQFQRKSHIGRSISVDESDAFHFIPRSRLTDSSLSEGHLTDSFCEVDVPFPLSSSATKQPTPPSSLYSKSSFSHKLFGSYNPFEKLSSKSSNSISGSGRSSNSSSSSKSSTARNNIYNSPVRKGTGAAARQDSLDCNTIELLSPILEQEKLCTECQSWRSLIIVIAVRLGGDTFNTIYERVIKALLRHPLCIGLVGGKARRAFYFVGYQEDQLLYLDPHTSQEAVPCSWGELPDVSSYHCDTPRKVTLSRLEPSATLGFYCHTRTDFAQLIVDLPKLTTVVEGRLSYPLVEVKGGSRQQHDATWIADLGILGDIESFSSNDLKISSPSSNNASFSPGVSNKTSNNYFPITSQVAPPTTRKTHEPQQTKDANNGVHMDNKISSSNRTQPPKEGSSKLDDFQMLD